MPFAWGIISLFPRDGFLLLLFYAFILGVIVVDSYVKRTHTKDPSFAVIDEVAGQWLGLAVLPSFSWSGFIIGFFLFRFFDILKPPLAAN